ncbi:Tfp pilus assembly protein FimT/FimU [Methylibium sp. Pch-M]|uniref:pilus assembly FimT family protein n=1 Tax=Methylibium sp. Pch-M TaxID=2082386 RepID=UPI001F5CE6B9|nr:GspH/FimT family pseudopilin [Methylibium sp. Pch-M]
MQLIQQPRSSWRGFTLVELMVTITLLAILLAVAAPSFASWIRNTRVRTTSQVLQDGLRLAQAEAVRRNRTVSFFLTNVANPTATSAAAANGSNWGVRTLTLITGETAELVRSGALAGVVAGVNITGPSAVCFNAAGQQVANAAEGCAIDPTAPTVTYDIAHGGTVAGVDRALRVTASLGGRVRMCDPAKTLSATNPDGC